MSQTATIHYTSPHLKTVLTGLDSANVTALIDALEEVDGVYVIQMGDGSTAVIPSRHVIHVALTATT